MSGSSGHSSLGEPQPRLRIKHTDKRSTKLPKASGLAWQGVLSVRTMGQPLFSIVSLKLGRAGGVTGCPSLSKPGSLGLLQLLEDVAAAEPQGCPPPCSLLGLGRGDGPSKRRSLVTAAWPIPTRRQNSRNPAPKLKDLRVQTLLVNYVFFVCVVTTFLLLVLKAKIYPLLIFVLF